MGCWSLCTLSFSTLVECVSDIDGTHMNTLQDGWTALMVASQKGQVAGVTMLLDRGAKINMQKKVTGVIIHCVDAMQHVPESTVVDDDVCAGTLHFCHVILFLLHVINDFGKMHCIHFNHMWP